MIITEINQQSGVLDCSVTYAELNLVRLQGFSLIKVATVVIDSSPTRRARHAKSC